MKELLRRVSAKLLVPLVGLILVALILAIFLPGSSFVVPVMIVVVGAGGGFIGLQRRLKELTPADLSLIAESWVYTCLSPLVGGMLALLLYVLFLSELVTGTLFPQFAADDTGGSGSGFSVIFAQHAASYQDYAKLFFWSFVAGFSEKFVTNVISRFEGTAVKDLAAK